MNIYELRDLFKTAREPVQFSKEKSALVLVDVQKLASPQYIEYEAKEIFNLKPEEYQEALEDYTERFNASLNHISQVLEACRKKNIMVIHIKIESRTSTTARDVSPIHISHNFWVPKGSVFGEFCDEVKPIEDEIVLKKCCSGAHVGTNINNILHFAGIDNIIMSGYYTDQCITTAARDFADLGYAVTLVEDACSAFTQKQHEEALDHIVGSYVRGGNTEEIVKRIESIK